jgi:hypothetical protein
VAGVEDEAPVRVVPDEADSLKGETASHDRQIDEDVER